MPQEREFTGRTKVNAGAVSNLIQLEQLAKSSWFHLNIHNFPKAQQLKFALDNIEIKAR